MRPLLARIRAVFRSREMDRDLDQELEAHLDLLTQEHQRHGLTPEDARRAARVELGGVTSLREQHREVRGVPILETIWQDLRYAFRMIAKDRWFSAAAITVLALGIGVNTIGFTIIDTAFLKGLPVQDSANLYSAGCCLSGPVLNAWSGPRQALSGLAAYAQSVTKLSGDRAFPEEATAAWVTTNLFSTLGLRPLMGRDFTPDEARAPVVLIGYDVWKNRFAGNPNVLGKTLRLERQSATIIGVMPEGMRFPDNQQVWAPWQAFRAQLETSPNSRVLNVVARLRKGATVDQAAAELTSLAKQNAPAALDKDFSVHMRPFSDGFGLGEARSIFLVVGGAVSFVLLIACANVANLLLSRSAFRTREMAVRMSLGATRPRIVRQLLMESLLLAVLGGTLGLLLASAGVPLFDSVLPAEKPYWLVFTFSNRAVAYVAGICMLITVLFGLAPALELSNAAGQGALKESSRGSHGGRRMSFLSSSLVVTELTLAVVLLVGAGLVMRSFGKLYSVDPGFPQDNLVMFGMDTFGRGYETKEQRVAFVQQLEDSVAALPGIDAAAITSGVPPRDRIEQRLEIDGVTLDAKFVSTVAITPRFFNTLGIPVLRGRNFTAQDGASGTEAVLINERLAQQFFPGQDPLGKRIRFTGLGPGFRLKGPVPPPEAWRTIVGITPTIRQGSVKDAYLNSVVYTPFRQDADGAAYLVVRSRQTLGAVFNAVRQASQQIDPDQPVRAGQTLEQWAASEQWPYRVFGALLAILAAIALALSSVGLYAVMAYSVAQRTQEIGVRMAIGAQTSQIAWQVLRRGLRQLGLGLVFGIGGALALSKALSALLVDTEPYDPLTFASIAILLAIVSVAACLIPARRAARVDPVVALRSD